MQVNSFYPNIGKTYTGIVTGAELESVTKEIFGIASETAKVGLTQKTEKQTSLKPASDEINLYNRRTDIDLTRQIAQNNSDYNLQLSETALKNIQALNNFAITNQQNTHKLVEGKIVIPNDETGKKSGLETTAIGHTTTVEKIFAFEKDNPFTTNKSITSHNAGSKLA